ncbi:MAG: sulfatase-like hydrolase/transferase [Oscillospiraceae bacterium]|nr:sulfatase-like hydrolase/transferase [Oscillospiraceae bacterium]
MKALINDTDIPLMFGLEEENSFSFYDMDLIAPFRDFIGAGSNKQADGLSQPHMAVIHSLGCHFKYSSRYPSDMRFFRPDLYDISSRDIFSLRDWDGITVERNHPGSSFANTARTILTNSYDNALRYTDWFLDSLITTLAETDRPAVLMYVSDHGENLLDDDQHRMLHGQESTSVYEYHVPLFVWASDSYKQRYPDRWATLLANSTHLVSTMNVYHTMLDLGGVQVAQYDSTRSLASPALLPDTLIYRVDGNLNPQPLDLSEPSVD